MKPSCTLIICTAIRVIFLDFLSDQWLPSALGMKSTCSNMVDKAPPPSFFLFSDSLSFLLPPGHISLCPFPFHQINYATPSGSTPVLTFSGSFLNCYHPSPEVRSFCSMPQASLSSLQIIHPICNLMSINFMSVYSLQNGYLVSSTCD
jgi:hypothetical protein